MSVVRMNQKFDETQIFGTDSKNYNSSRLDYNHNGWLQKILFQHLDYERKKQDITIADIGAGTGKFGSVLQCLGFNDVHFVEPADGSIKYLLGPQGREIDPSFVHQGTAADTKLRSQSIDLIVFGDAAHWTRFDEKATLNEMRRVLKPGGKILSFVRTPSQECTMTVKLHEIMTDLAKQGEIPEYLTAGSKFLKDTNPRYTQGKHLVNSVGAQLFEQTVSVRWSRDKLANYLASHSTLTRVAQENPELISGKDGIVEKLFNFAKENGHLTSNGKIKLEFWKSICIGSVRDVHEMVDQDKFPNLQHIDQPSLDGMRIASLRNEKSWQTREQERTSQKQEAMGIS